MPGMPNLLAQAYGGAQVRAGSVPNPATASQAAYGASVAPAGPGAALAPNDAGGLAIWVGIAGLAALVLIYYSLPG